VEVAEVVEVVEVTDAGSLPRRRWRRATHTKSIGIRRWFAGFTAAGPLTSPLTGHHGLSRRGFE
jgi:hypothetical protein